MPEGVLFWVNLSYIRGWINFGFDIRVVPGPPVGSLSPAPVPRLLSGRESALPSRLRVLNRFGGNGTGSAVPRPLAHARGSVSVVEST